MSAREASLLRLHAEPCVYYPETVVHQALMAGLRPFMDTLERFYLAWARDPAAITHPVKQVYERPGVRGDWRVMPCAVDGRSSLSDACGGGIDAVKVIGTNEEGRIVGDKISVGKALLLHPIDHHVEAIFDVAALSSFRTAAISVLAWKYCGHDPHAVAGIVGAGRIGFYTAAILREWLDCRRLRVHDADEARSGLLAETIAERFGGSVEPGSLEEACRGSRALFLATSSPRPVVDAELGRNASFISSVGADADNLSELAPDLAAGHLLVSESPYTIACGDLRRWHAAGLIGPDDIRLLADVIGDATGGTDPRRPAIFVSTGTAVQDALICWFLHERLGGRGGMALEDQPPQPPAPA